MRGSFEQKPPRTRSSVHALWRETKRNVAYKTEPKEGKDPCFAS